MNYKDTLNLPRTDFPMRAKLKEREPLTVERWVEMDLYEKVQEANRELPLYVLHDGPPYPTGDLHIGTGMNKILKDIIVRFKSLSGFRVPFIPGWDCHGLPIEHKVMMELGSKAEALSDLEIRERCLRFADNYVNANRRQFRALGCLGDWDRPYLTVHHSYEAAVLKIFGKMVERGYVYRQLKPIHWCFSCRTALAEAELEYGEKESPSIFVGFPLQGGLEEVFPGQGGAPASVMIWTTTPWTIPGNVAVALHPEFAYALAEVEWEGDRRERFLLAEATLPRVAAAVGAKGHRVLAKAPGKRLDGLRYRHPLDGRECPLILASYVNLEEGTGCVHTAPGHGLDDYISGVKYGLPVLSPVDASGRFTDEAGELQGRNVFDSNGAVIERLREAGFLLGSGAVLHSYPHCWRCKRPVIFRATDQWFVSMTTRDLRERVLDEIGKVRWVPPWGEIRIRNMVRDRPDWCISRQRKWGVPIPAFYCASCGAPLLTKGTVDHVAGIFAARGSNAWFASDPAELLPEGSSCGTCGGTGFVKENDIFDVWFESGSSFRAVVMEHAELSFPADLYLEGSDQHRGWFQLSLIPAVASEDRAPYRAVLTHGFVVGENGQKMSKSQGNFISVEDAIREFGGDILRLWFSSVDYRSDVHVSRDAIRRMSETYRRVRNTFRFMLGNLADFDPARHSVPYGELTEMDRWALAVFGLLLKRVRAAFDAFEFHRVVHEVHDFLVVELSSLYLDVLKDRLYADAADALERRSSQTVLYRLALDLAVVLSPILPFTMEEAWSHMPAKGTRPESVHLARWPEGDAEWIDAALLSRWKRLLSVRSEVLRVLERARAGKRIGNSLEASVRLSVEGEGLRDFLDSFPVPIRMLFIVSEVKLFVEHEPEGFERAAEIEGLWLKVERSPYAKCARCWNYFPSVGESEAHPSLCSRCLRVVAGMRG